MTRELKFSAVILAGGESRRMGRDKAGIKWKGRSLLARAISVVSRAGAGEIFISGHKDGDYSAHDVPVLLDSKPGNGPLGGIERALRVAQFPLVLVLAVDMPRMTAAFLRKLVQRCSKVSGVVPSHDDNLEALAAIYHKSAHALLLKQLRKKRFAAREFAETCLHNGLLQRFELTAKQRVYFANCNSPSDLRALARNRKNRR